MCDSVINFIENPVYVLEPFLCEDPADVVGGGKLTARILEYYSKIQ